VRFTFIAEQKKAFPVSVLCRVLAVSRSGYYAWRQRPVAARVVEDEQLLGAIAATHAEAYRSYGSPRIHRALRAAGTRVGRNRVARLMRVAGIRGRSRRRYRHTTDSRHADPIAANLLERDFTATAPNQKWVVDTTELTVGSGKRYLAAVIDLYARSLVGWALRPTNDRDLTIAALAQAVQRRAPGPGLVHHSDRGTTYTSADYRAMLDVHAFTASMSGTGNCYDNAAMESWFATLKAELGDTFADDATAAAALFSYIEVFYNQQRLHSTLDYLSPADYERTHAARVAA
jgi:putative transposase